MANKIDQETVSKTLEDLEALNKSEEEYQEGFQDDDDSVISALEKALLDYDDFDFEDLEKAEDEDEEAEDEDEEDMEKSEMFSDFEDELVKASEAYNNLAETVAEAMEKSERNAEDFGAALADLTSLVTGIGKAVVGLAKSLPEVQGGIADLKAENDALQKSLNAFGQAPGAPSGAVLGLNKSETEKEGEYTKAQLTGALTKAVRDHGQGPLAGYLSKVSINGVKSVPDAVIQQLKGLELLP